MPLEFTRLFIIIEQCISRLSDEIGAASTSHARMTRVLLHIVRIMQPNCTQLVVLVKMRMSQPLWDFQWILVLDLSSRGFIPHPTPGINEKHWRRPLDLKSPIDITCLATITTVIAVALGGEVMCNQIVQGTYTRTQTRAVNGYASISPDCEVRQAIAYRISTNVLFFDLHHKCIFDGATHIHIYSIPKDIRFHRTNRFHEISLRPHRKSTPARRHTFPPRISANHSS